MSVAAKTARTHTHMQVFRVSGSILAAMLRCFNTPFVHVQAVFTLHRTTQHITGLVRASCQHFFHHFEVSNPVTFYYEA